eukprot:6646033-Pyramimonas_sp.AAC.1
MNSFKEVEGNEAGSHGYCTRLDDLHDTTTRPRGMGNGDATAVGNLHEGRDSRPDQTRAPRRPAIVRAQRQLDLDVDRS